MRSYEKAVQEQLEAYNQHDIDKFMECYTEDIKAIDLDQDKVLFEGKEQMRAIYAEKFQNKHLYCHLVNRMILHRTIIDHEEVVLNEDKDILKAIAIYDLAEDGLISTVRFIKGRL